MRAVIQVARDASVSVDGTVVGTYEGLGLVVLLGVTHDDGPDQIERVARKIAQLRVLPGERSAEDEGAPILLVSQFTLYGDTRKGRRPSWTRAAPGDVAEPIYEAVAEALRARGLRVAQGVFGAMMDVAFTNVGPMTVLVEAEA
ncbi:D-aminoacyl-tRNA deacylase [Nanchangia anserum]|uniref:D-aminoacyl-tRNA deacylase n=1 Tax=Nanchangia anserum TaxID=2692125 RepID=A0A8I0KRI1_9ACTO|nr:D-aminoacyl-tRNA deacylase [Nanchangia anserum]MBD3689437.1 D-tyrosyl-tRNA(Tyr) deacylase [Nanchangia anserum]